MTLARAVAVAATVVVPVLAVTCIGGIEVAAEKKPVAAAKADPYAAYRRVFKRLDADGDGAVTEAEYLERTRWPAEKAGKIFRASDANGDGKVTELEYCENRRVTDKAKEVFKWLDADGSGKVSKQEVAAAAERIFAEMDADRSGDVNIPEFLSTRWRWQVDVRWKKPDKPEEPKASAAKAGRAGLPRMRHGPDGREGLQEARGRRRQEDHRLGVPPQPGRGRRSPGWHPSRPSSRPSSPAVLLAA